MEEADVVLVSTSDGAELCVAVAGVGADELTVVTLATGVSVKEADSVFVSDSNGTELWEAVSEVGVTEVEAVALSDLDDVLLPEPLAPAGGGTCHPRSCMP